MVDKPLENSQVTITMPRDFPSGKIVAFDVDVTVYMRDYAQDFYEWINGVLIKMSPISGKHGELMQFIRLLIDTYFSFRKIGKTRAVLFVMRLDSIESRRELDLQVILNSNAGTLTDTYMDGVADICAGLSAIAI